jgi:hypothetical protein
MTGTCRSGENEGSTKDPTTETGTTTRRGSVGNWRVGYGAGRVKQEMVEAEDKLTNLTVQGAEEITTTEATIIKEVEGEKVASQNFISAWKSRNRPEWLGTSHR